MNIVGSPNNKRFVSLMLSWKKRLQTFARSATYMAAKYTYEKVLSRIPAGRAYREYRRSLRVVEVAGTKKHPTFAVISKSRKRGSREGVRAQQYLIHVRARRRLAPTPEAVKILEANNPWTVSTLPFKPKDTQAVLEYEKASVGVVRRIAKEREESKATWGVALKRLGVKPSGVGAGKQHKSTVVEDGVQLEFGRGTIVARPHWRPVLRSIDRIGILGMIKQRLAGKRYLERMFTSSKEPTFKMPRMEIISPRQALLLIDFSKRILTKG